MGTPIYILAGQSNATAMKDDFAAALKRSAVSGDFHSAVVATGGAPLTRQRNGDDWATAGELRGDLVQTIKAILENDPDAYLGGVIWVQGEADTYDLGHPEDYGVLLQELFEEVRDTLQDGFSGRRVVDGDINLVISGLSERAPQAPTREYWDGVRGQQISLAKSSDDIEFIDPDKIAQQNGVSTGDMFKDSLHYSTEFQKIQMDALVETVLSQDDQVPDIYYHQGTSGADSFVGSSVDDAYFINHRRDQVFEAAGQGYDTVLSDRFIFLNRLSNNIEAAVLTGGKNTMAYGNQRKNEMEGNAGDNVLKGNLNDDILRGNDGHDKLFGGMGDDVLIGGTGWDQFEGGAGRDVFVFADEDRRWKEQVLDYNDQQDIIRIDTKRNMAFDDLHIMTDDEGRGAVVNYGTGSFLLMGVSKSVLGADDFEFI